MLHIFQVASCTCSSGVFAKYSFTLVLSVKCSQRYVNLFLNISGVAGHPDKEKCCFVLFSIEIHRVEKGSVNNNYKYYGVRVFFFINN